MTVWFTSDLHLGHCLVADKRGFATVQDHDEVLLDNWDKTVKPDDVVWVVGDIAVSKPLDALAEIRGLPGRKRLILGNHDKAHPMYRDAFKWFGKYTETFEWVTTSARIKVNGTEVLLSHFPYVRDRGDARNTQWRLPDERLPLLHGHTHGRERLTNTLIYPGFGEGEDYERVEVHVGADAWDFTPVSDLQVHKLLQEGLK